MKHSSLHISRQVAAGLGFAALLMGTAWASPSTASAEAVSSKTIDIPAVIAQGGNNAARSKSLRAIDTTRNQAAQAHTVSFQRGQASWYGPGFHNRRTASGELFNMHGLTAAHRTLPFGTKVLVKNAHTGKSVIVRINDRGPYAHGRIIDLSKGAAQALGMNGHGVTHVELYRASGHNAGQMIRVSDSQ